MDNDLERSIRLLEDALSTPSKGLFKKTPTKTKKDNTRLELSLTMSPNEIRRLFSNDDYQENTLSTFLTEKSMTGSVLQAGTPWTYTVDSLFIEFVEVLQNYEGGILEIVADLARCCSDTLKVIQGLKAQVSVSKIPDEKWLENERNTWRLIYVLYQDRINRQSLMDEAPIPPYTGSSEKLCIDNLFKRDNLIRESQLVVDWLERNALERNDPILQNADYTFGWEHTIHQLLAPEAIAIGSRTEIIKNIHPDAPQYEKCPLHHLDEANDKQLHMRVFTEIRSGRLEAAQELLFNCGHASKAAVLEGWKLYHNPNIKEEDENEEYENECLSLQEGSMEMSPEFIYRDVEGNSNRSLWKVMALRFCQKNDLNAYEKASVAAFCGSLKTMLVVCNTWEDHLWAYLRTMIDIRVESEIRDIIIKKYRPLPEEYWEQRMSLNEIFDQLHASKNKIVATESQKPEYIIQKHIILEEIPKLITLLEKWSEDNSASTHFLRFLAHLILFFYNIGEGHNKESCEKVIEAYIRRLSEMMETQLVAFYVSKLGGIKQVLIYASHLEKIEMNEERKLALEYGEANGIDMFAVTKTVVENIRNRPTITENIGNLTNKTSKEDEFKISALDWLTFYEEQRTELLYQSNALIFTFLTLGKQEAAQLAIKKIPSDTIEKILHEGDVSEEINQIIKEHLSYKVYLDAIESFNDWFKQYQNKPIQPQDLSETAQFSEKVAHQHKLSQYKAELERWKLTTSHTAKTAKTMLYNVLLFPQGWLVGGENADYLRSICIPEIVILLYTVLFESGLHEEAVQLADLIASEKYALYKVFSKEKLAELLEKLCESSLALLSAKKDPWGSGSTS